MYIAERPRRSASRPCNSSCGHAERRILARASVRPRAGSDAQNSQLWSPGGLSLQGYMFTLPEFSRPSRISGPGPQLDRRLRPWVASGWRGARSFTPALPRPMYRGNVPASHTAARLPQVLAWRHSVMYWRIGHYRFRFDENAAERRHDDELPAVCLGRGRGCGCLGRGGRSRGLARGRRAECWAAPVGAESGW